MKIQGPVLLSLYCLIAGSVFGQTTDPVLITHLPSILYESSGVEINHSNSIWTHNDSGDSARIFNIDTAGNVLRILYFDVETATDCEESTRDHDGNYYLGDFGNNNNDRNNLRIYKIANPDTTSADTVVPEIITFSYPDQTLFPPDSAHMNFDCEAMFHFQNSLYLFSKNRGTSTWSKMYRLPDQPGDYVAELMDSFNTGNWVTAVDISPSGQNMALLSESRIWLFTGISGTNFFGGEAHVISMTYTQKEAVVFVNDSLIYITDEYFFGYGGNLYKLNLASCINGLNEVPENNSSFLVYPNPATETLYILAPPIGSPFSIKIKDEHGKTVAVYENETTIPVAHLGPGMYFISIENTEIWETRVFIKLSVN